MTITDTAITDEQVAALQIAIRHIEHMAAWIGKQNAGYSFESLGEDMPGIRAAARSMHLRPIRPRQRT